jgi:hypothetical protein
MYHFTFKLCPHVYDYNAMLCLLRFQKALTDNASIFTLSQSH